MKTEKSTPKAIRWYAPDEKAEKRLIELGAPKRHIYRGDNGGAPGKFKMRKGEYLGVVDGFRAFGKSRHQIEPIVTMIHSWGAAVLDVETGKDSRTHSFVMFNEALNPPKPSPEYLAKRAAEKLDARLSKAGAMHKRDAAVIWRNPKLSVVEAIDLMPGWAAATAYKHLGKRDVPAGRRPK